MRRMVMALITLIAVVLPILLAALIPAPVRAQADDELAAVCAEIGRTQAVLLAELISLAGEISDLERDLLVASSVT